VAARRRKGRDVRGIVLLDKPVGIGSNEALQIVKRLFTARKAGHTGSLDRLACGLLPVCLGEATKLSGFLLSADKRYEAVLQLGIKTSTGDAEGEVREQRPVGKLSRREVESVLAQFRGEMDQIPPMHSAVKHNGQRLYKLARQGLVVERKPRRITVHELTLSRLEEDRLGIEVLCTKGTYIRTLAEDIGEALGCGAHVAFLRRTGSGPFHADGMVGLDVLRTRAEQGMQHLDEVLIPMQTALPAWPEVNLTDDLSYYLRKGQAVLVPHAPTDGWVKLFGVRDRFLGVGEVLDDGRVAPRRLVNVGS